MNVPEDTEEPFYLKTVKSQTGVAVVRRRKAMRDLDRLLFSQVRDVHPDRYEKVNLMQDQISDIGDRGEYVVDRDDSDKAHKCTLVVAYNEAFGHCSCNGYEYHDGPCSHLCGMWRARQYGLVDVPVIQPDGITAELPEDRQQERAQRADLAQPLAADGGQR